MNKYINFIQKCIDKRKRIPYYINIVKVSLYAILSLK
jgi:hypothetical protein